MNRDRRAVRKTRKKISFNEYDLERVERILNSCGGEEAKFIYECFRIGLDSLEREIRAVQTEAA